MKARSSFLAIALISTTLAVLPAASAQKGTIARAKQYVTRALSAAEKANSIMDGDQSSDGQILDSSVKSITKQIETAKEMIEKAKEQLSNAKDPEVLKAPVAKEIEDAEKKISETEERLKKAQQNIGEQGKLLAEGAAKDQTTVEALIDRIGKFRGNVRGTTPDLETAKQWAQISAQASELLKKYGGAQSGRADNREFKARIVTLQLEMDGIKSDFEKYKKEEVPKQKKFLAELTAVINERAKDKMFLALAGRVDYLVNGIYPRCQSYEILMKDDPSYDPTLIKEANAAKANGEAKVKALAKEIIANNPIPTDGYSGGDKASLMQGMKTAFNKLYPGKKILRTIITGSAWQRDVKWTWEERESAWVKTDLSMLAGVVLVESKDPAIIWVYPCNLKQNHLAQNAITAIVPLGVEDPGPLGSILRSKLK